MPVFHAHTACWYVKITITGDANDEKKLVKLMHGYKNNIQVNHEDSCSKRPGTKVRGQSVLNSASRYPT